MHYVLGLDIGIASVGWAVLALDTQDDPVRILDLGSRIFERAEVPKTGESLAAPRRTARGARRRLRRRRFRIARVKKYLVRRSILTRDELQSLYTTPSDIVTLRKEGLYRSLTPKEWAKILIYLAKHRGFKSNRKAAAVANAEDGEMLKAIQANAELLKNYQTVGEMLCDDETFRNHKRNKGDSHLLTVSRQMLLDEIKKLYAVQRTFQNDFAADTLEDEYIQIFSSQRNFDEGPACGPYSGNQIEKMIGFCSLETKTKEKRAPKASFAFMAFNLWQKINNLRYQTTGEYHTLSSQERQTLYDWAWEKEAITYKDIRKKLSLPAEARFKDVPYRPDSPIEDIEKKQKFSWVKPYHTLRKALDGVHKNRITELSHEQIDAIAYAFSVYKNDVSIARYLDAHQIAEEDKNALLSRLKPFSKFGHVSAKACYKLLPFLEQGMVYTDACAAAGYTLQAAVSEPKNIPNPVVKRAVSQTLKVVKAIQEKYGCAPVEVHIELARDMARSYADRQKMKKSMDDNQAQNEKIKEYLKREHRILQPTGQDIVKFKLYQQQNGRCAYSLQAFDLSRFMHEPDYAEVDHIIPYSRSMDDSYHNKVVVLTAENRQKGNRTPMEYLQDKPARRDAFVAWVKANIRDYRKRDNLLLESYTADKASDWKDRHINDTRYISRFLLNYLEDTMKLTPGCTKRKKRILAVNGAVTSYVRKRLGIPKIRANGDLHHAVDAVIIAAVTEGIIQKITRYSKMRELHIVSDDQGNMIDTRTGEILPQTRRRHKLAPFPEPWPCFRSELEARVSDHAAEAIQALHLPTYGNKEEIQTPFVSRMPNHKVTGQAHEETIKSSKLREEGYSIIKTKLSDLKLGKDGEIEGYYNKESDVLLYHALKARLQLYNGNGSKAFEEPFYKPTADGKQGPLVKKVKIMEKTNLNVPVYQKKGMAKNGAMVRTDVFGVEEKGKLQYYMVPIYVADTVKKRLPNKAVVANTSYAEWKEMDDRDFLFSLYPNDLIYVKKKKELKTKAQTNCTIAPPADLKEALLYYKGCDIKTGAFTAENHDNTYVVRGLGIKTLVSLEKYVVDVLGNIHKVKKEKRMPITFKKSKKKKCHFATS